jgi:hypothetical protein
MPTPFIQSKGDLISIHIDSPLTEESYQAVTRQIEETAAAVGKVRLFLVLKHYPSLSSAEDLYDDLKFVKLQAERIDKVAVVLDRLWKRTFLGLFSLFGRVNLNCFDISDIAAATAWINSRP